MSSCLSGGGRAYGFDLEMIKSPSSSTITSQTSSPSLSESSNFSNTISTTRKPRTPRKRPNQTYNEAAALLSTACPNIFSPKIVTKPFKFSKSHDHFVNYSSSADLLLPFRVFDNSGFLIHQPIPDKPNSRAELKVLDFCENLKTSSGFSGSCLEDFDAESILDEEIIEEGGIDSIMGNLSVENGDDSTDFSTKFYDQVGTCYGYPMGLGFGGEFGFNRAFRHVDEGEWWRFPQVDIGKFSPKLNNKMVEKKKKKVEKVLEIKGLVQETQEDVGSTISKQEKEKGKENEENLVPIPKPRLLLSLNFDEVANAWSDRGSPFPDEISSQDSAGGDLQARLASIDLFSENGGVREARVLRYKEKRRTRLFSKKIRYQVRKVNADQRPRMKGRFVRRPDSP